MSVFLESSLLEMDGHLQCHEQRWLHVKIVYNFKYAQENGWIFLFVIYSIFHSFKGHKVSCLAFQGLGGCDNVIRLRWYVLKAS